MHYLYLALAILSEVVGTSALQASQQFTRPLPSAIVFLGYGIAFYFLALTLKVMPLGLVYALWAGLGIVLITAVGWVVFGQKLDFAALLGIGLIIAGVVVIHLFSKSATH
ncbi:MAG: multidrug efflux SMR transporter [Dinoroseobacter sp.]|nr:multidrug efflux SMR transporter [Dinoroseobacter sp.]MDJ0993830.1 multidrug efflux SMR transporter [Dinoroseobacter sp.]